MPPSKAFLNDWSARTTELIDKYSPELIYFDWWTSAPVYEPMMRDTAAYYYNRSKARNEQGIIAYKGRSEEHTSELQSLMRTSYAVFCLKKQRTHDRTARRQIRIPNQKNSNNNTQILRRLITQK